MNKLLVIVAIVVLITGLGAAKGVSDVGSGHGEEVTEAVSSTQHDEFDSEDKMKEKTENGKDVRIVQEKKLLIVDKDGDNTPIIKMAVTEGKVKFFDERKGYASERSSRKGRNPQTGKEIKIPARSDYGHKGREPEEKEVELVIPEKAKEKPQRGIKFAIVEKESGEEYFVHATGLIDEIRDEDDVTFEIREGRKGMNAVDVRRTD